MDCYELSLTYTSPIEKEIIDDVLTAELREISFKSFTENEKSLLGCMSEALYDKRTLDDKLADFPLKNTRIDYTSKWIESKDWNRGWERNYFKPIRTGNECTIRAFFHKAEPGCTYNIIINPKTAFDTSNHETTYLMISGMLKLDLEGKELLDMGCGTAVLATLIRLKGAKRVVAIDIDKWAYNNALENVRLNHTEDIQVVLGGVEKIKGFGLFDIVLASISWNILLNDVCQYTNSVKQGNILFMSGFYVEDIPAIEAECQKNGLKLDSYNERSNWVAVKVLKG